ncbi:MAG: DUF3768 domain-containing protein [Pseudomonadota bacterium]
MKKLQHDQRTNRIAKLNDLLRKTFIIGGQMTSTGGIASLDENTQAKIFQAVRTFDAFTIDNDPYGEHDFGHVQVCGETIFWKIDYYDANLEYGSEDPSNPAITTRILTIMLAEEY